MKTVTTSILFILLLGFSTLYAQVNSELVNQPNSGRHSAYCETTVTSAVPACVIELPALSPKRIYLEGVTIESEVAGEFVIYHRGTRTGGTLVTNVPLTGQSSTLKVYSGSAIASPVSTITGGKLAADVAHTRSLEGYRMAAGLTSTVQSISVVGPSMTGKFRVTVKWAEGTY